MESSALNNTSSLSDGGNSLSVIKALAGKSVLVTGTTGFVGKVIVEKLLRDVPSIRGVYLLIRGNEKYPEASDRFVHEIASSSIFERLKIEDDDAFEVLCNDKVHCITGEVTESCFGLGTAEYESLADKIDVVVNSAASVNFREELDTALSINALCLYNMTAFVKVAGNIPLLQVSTCYVNGLNQGGMREQNVKPAKADIPLSSDGYYDVAPSIASMQVKIDRLKARYTGQFLAEKLIDLGIAESNRSGWNDTYTFTKWMGEQILRKELKGSSLTILRPAIVESTLSEPAPGWIEGVKVADAILMAYAREKVMFFPGNPDGIIDIIPADLVANSIILGVAELLDSTVDHRVYQCCSSGSNPVKIKQLIKFVQQEADDNYQAYDKLFYRKPKRPFIMVSKHVFKGMMSGIRLPLKILNTAGRLIGKNIQSDSLENIDTGMKLSTVFSFYTEPKYVFHNDQLIALSERCCEADKNRFPVDSLLIDWEHYMRNIHIPGLNKYALKERKLYKLRPKMNKQQTKAA